MNERRFRAVLEDITKTIEDYGEETVIAAFRTALDRFNYEVVKRDPGPCCAYADYYEAEGIMTPIHECPSEAPDAWIHAMAEGAGKDAALSLLNGRMR